MESRQKVNRRHQPNDVPFFLVAIPLINAYNYYLTYTNIQLSWFTAYTYSLDTLMGYAAWWAMRTIILFLDRHLLFSSNPGKRIIIQLLVTTAAGLLVIISCTEVLNKLFRDHPVPISFYQYDILLFVVWFLVINGIYIGLHFYTALRQAERLNTQEQSVRNESFVVRSGRQEILIHFQDISGFYVDGDYTALITFKLKKYLLDQSLDKVEQTIPAEDFFRLNRQYIMNRQAIKGYERLENGKLRVLLNAVGPFPEDIQVSRFKAPGFKAWFKLV